LRNIIFHTPQYYRWLTCYVCVRLRQYFGKDGCYFRCHKLCTCNYPCTQRFWYSAVAHILTPSVNFAFGSKSGFKNKCRARAAYGLDISGSGRVQFWKWGPFATLCVHLGMGQQGEIEMMHPSPTNSKNRLKSFCEVGYANYRLNVFTADKRISMEILVGVDLYAWYPVELKILVAFSKNGNVQEKYLSSL